MANVILYKANNTPYRFTIGSVTPGGSYPPNVQNLYTWDGSLPSGTVNGVQVPSMSHYVDWSFNPLVPVVNREGTNLKDLETTIGTNSSLTLYTEENSGGSSFTFSTNEDGNLYAISINSGIYNILTYNNYGYSVEIYFAYCDGVGLSQYDNLCIYFKHYMPGAAGGVYEGLHFGGSCGLNCVFTHSTSSNLQERFNSGTTLESVPGDKGFKPTAARTTKDEPGQGGRGTTNKVNPDYAGDSVTQPGAPDESVASGVGSGFLNIYKVDTANLNKVGQCLYGSTMLGLIQSIAVNPLDFIVSLMVFPCSPSVGSSENIKLGGWLAAATGGAALGFDATGTKLSKEFEVFDFGTVSIPENWGNFLDYSQTTVELYLPFIGSVNLDVSECMGGNVNVQYTVDFFTGMCVANVLCSRANYTLPSGKALSHVHAQHSYQGNCAIQLPLSAVNYGTMVGSLINACTQGITNPVSGFMGIAADAIGGGFRPNVTSKGNIVANAGFCSVLYPYIRLTRPITAEPDTYQQVIGYMSYINTTLGECEDLCVCDSIDLRGISGATESEMNRIKQMCMEGVYV